MRRSTRFRTPIHPFVRFLIAIGGIVVALSAVALVLFVVLPIIGIVVTSVIALALLVVLSLLIAVPLLALIGVVGIGLRRGPRVIGNGVEATEMRTVSPFDIIEVRGMLRVRISCDGNPSIAVTGDENLLEHVRTEVRGRRLLLDTDSDLQPKAGLMIDVAAAELSALRTSGAIRAEVSDVDAEEFAVTVSGASRIDASGRAGSLQLHLSGAANVDMVHLVGERARVKISGTARATVHATQLLDVRISGAGQVVCHGQPDEVKRKISGVGKVILR